MTARSRVQPGDGDPRHGMCATYNHLGCRCEPCTAAIARYQAVKIARYLARGLAADDPRHGTENGYVNYRCRCMPCTAAGRAANVARYYLRKAIPA